MQELEFKITFELDTKNVKETREFNNTIMQLLNNLLLNSKFPGEVECLSDIKAIQSPHSLATYRELESEV